MLRCAEYCVSRLGAQRSKLVRQAQCCRMTRDFALEAAHAVAI